MKLTLLKKSIFLHICIALLGFAGVTYLSYGIDYRRVYRQQTAAMYRQAVSIAQEYATYYFSEKYFRLIETELNTVSKLSQTRIMFIEPDGSVLLDTGYIKNSTQPSSDNYELYNIEDFNYAALGSSYSTTGDFYGIFDEPHISVFAPINNSFIMKGYAVVHMPESVITQQVYVTFNTNYFTLLLMLFLNFGFLLLNITQIHKPLKEITHAAGEYSNGNLAYRIKPKHNDEIGKLAASLDYMAAQLDESDQFQQKFLSNISHDFRSPLTSIKGYLEAIADGTIPPEMIPKYIGIVLFETDRLTKLTSNILTLNEMDPKTVRLEFTDFDINAIIRHTVETFEGTCKKKKIQFALSFSDDKELVHADKSKIQQVLYNLVDNAIKFSPENSTIYITVRERGERAQISVKDTGVGIPKDSHDKIWTRFYKTDSSRGRDKKGSGLGLSITKEIIQAHNEHIDVISTEGVGSEFIFTLQLARQDYFH